MAYIYNPKTGNFDSGGNGILFTLLKILFAAIEITGNYFAYKLSWGWLLLTIPLTFYCLVPLIEPEVENDIKIKSFIGYVAIMITILTPLPWWSILIAMVATAILILSRSN